MRSLSSLLSTFPREGRVEWIGVRPERLAPMKAIEHGENVQSGLAGNRRTAPGKRAVTLIQAEHLPVIAALTAHDAIDPALLRRNIVVSGINLLALKDRRFRVGSAVLEGTGICAPCSRMEEVLGEGGYNAMRGHGGITATVINTGSLSIGSPVVASDQN